MFYLRSLTYWLRKRRTRRVVRRQLNARIQKVENSKSQNFRLFDFLTFRLFEFSTFRVFDLSTFRLFELPGIRVCWLLPFFDFLICLHLWWFADCLTSSSFCTVPAALKICLQQPPAIIFSCWWDFLVCRLFDFSSYLNQNWFCDFSIFLLPFHLFPLLPSFALTPRKLVLLGEACLSVDFSNCSWSALTLCLSDFPFLAPSLCYEWRGFPIFVYAQLFDFDFFRCSDSGLFARISGYCCTCCCGWVCFWSWLTSKRTSVDMTTWLDLCVFSFHSVRWGSIQVSRLFDPIVCRLPSWTQLCFPSLSSLRLPVWTHVYSMCKFEALAYRSSWREHDHLSNIECCMCLGCFLFTLSLYRFHVLVHM